MRTLLLFLLLVATLPGPDSFSAELDYTGFFKAFLLLDHEGLEAPARVPEHGSPFGVLLAIAPGGEVGLCTVTHIHPTRVLTAAHCLKAGLSAQNYFVLFYNKRAEKTARPVQSIAFQGDGVLDIAILDIGVTAGAEWDMVAGRSLISSREKFFDEAVQAWSYTPIAHFPEYQTKYGNRPGMVFTPNRCKGSRTVPSIEMRKKTQVVGRISLEKQGLIDETKHLFLDHCSRAVVQGNSGSLVSGVSDPTAQIAVLHLFIADKDKLWGQLEKINEKNGPLDFYYKGADNQFIKLSWGYGDFLIGSGALLEALGPQRNLLSQ